jgi:hypothetical protein
VAVARVHSLVAANHGMPSSIETLSLKARKKNTDQNKAPMKKKHRPEESIDDRHGKDRTEQTKARVEQVRREVELLYEQADQAPPDCSTPSSAETSSLKASGYHKSSLSCCIQIKK